MRQGFHHLVLFLHKKFGFKFKKNLLKLKWLFNFILGHVRIYPYNAKPLMSDGLDTNL